MYNFRMTKKQQDIILNECNLDEVQTFIFNKLVEGEKRKNVYELVKNKYGLSQPSTDRRIKKINNIIHCYNEEKENITLKVYMHIFPFFFFCIMTYKNIVGIILNIKYCMKQQIVK